MHNRLKNIPVLLRSPLGRRELLVGIYYGSMPVLGRIAEAYRRTIVKRSRVIAVTGSFGKTTTTRAIRCALGLPLNPRVGVTRPSFKAKEVLRIKPRDRHAVIEASIEAPGQMAFAARFIRPDVAVITSIGSEHHRTFRTLEALRNEKAELVRSLPTNGLAVLNGDDPNVLWMKEVTKARVLRFGFSHDNDIYATDVSMNWPRGTEFVLHIEDEVRKIRLRLIGKHMVYAALAAVAVAKAAGVGLDRIATALQKLEPTPGRMEPIQLANGAILLRDDFKSPLETIETALETLSEIPASRRIIVLGQIADAPGHRRATQRHLGQLVAQVASYAIFFGLDCRSYVSGAERAGMDRNAILDAGINPSLAIETLTPMLRAGDVVLINGRSSEKLDRVTLALMGRRVGCTIGFCDAELRCSECKMLEGGWADYRHLHAAKNNVPAPVGDPSTQSAVDRA